MGKRVMQRGRFAVARSGHRKDARFGFRGQQSGGVFTRVIHHNDGKPGGATTAHHLPDGGRFVARRNENEGGRFHTTGRDPTSLR